MTVRASIDGSEPRITLSSEYHHKDIIKALPGAAWSNQDRAWKLPLSWTSCLALRTEFSEELEIAPDLAEWAWNEKATRIDPALALRELVQLDDGAQRHPELRVEDGDTRPTYDETDEPLVRAAGVPDTEIVRQALILQKEIKLFPHQAAGAAFMATALQAGIFDETGTGKSAQTIAAMRILHRMGENVFPALIIAPNTVKRAWVRELATWWPGLEVSLVEGGAAGRRKALEKPAHVYVMNWDIVAKHSRLARYGNIGLKRCIECGGIDERITSMNCQVHPRELNQLSFSTVVADEVHRGKSPNTAWTRALWAASEGARFRFGLTGTPIQDTLIDMWAILRFIAPDEYSAKTKFVDRFADTGYNMWGAFMINGLKSSMEAEYYGGVNPRNRRMLKKIVLPFLPPVLRETRHVPMTAIQARAYKQMAKDTLAELEGGEVLVAMNPLSRAARLMQFASSYAELITTELPDGRIDSHVKLIGPSNKVTAFLEDIKNGDFGDSSLVVFAQSRQLIDILSAEMTKKDLAHGLITGAIPPAERQRHIDEFQAGKTKYILVTIDAGGVGLTLTAADTMVFLQRHWSSTAMKQAESRAHRIGSQIHENILIVDYVSENTIEDRQIMQLGGKYGRIESILRDETLLKKLLKDEKIDEIDSLPDEIEDPADGGDE